MRSILTYPPYTTLISKPDCGNECVNNGNARFFHSFFFVMLFSYWYRIHLPLPFHSLSSFAFSTCTQTAALFRFVYSSDLGWYHISTIGNLSVVVWRNFVLLLVSFVTQETAKRLLKLPKWSSCAVNTNVDGNNNNHLGEFLFSDTLDYYCV